MFLEWISWTWCRYSVVKLNFLDCIWEVYFSNFNTKTCYPYRLLPDPLHFTFHKYSAIRFVAKLCSWNSVVKEAANSHGVSEPPPGGEVVSV
jgi:hypothetical protein